MAIYKKYYAPQNVFYNQGDMKTRLNEYRKTMREIMHNSAGTSTANTYFDQFLMTGRTKRG